MLEVLSQPFFQRVIVAGLLASLACGVIGTFVVARRMASLSGGLAHAAFGGVGLGYWLGVSPMLGATGFGLLAGLAVGLAYRRLGASLDTVIAMVWSVGMALGIVFIALTPGYAPDLMSYLFGSLLFVPWSYVWLVLALDLLIGLAVFLLYKEFTAVSFDEDFAEVTGVPVERIFLVLLALTALAIVTLIRVVGIILAIALLTVPAATARQWSDSLGRMMVIASALCALCTTGGLLLSYALGAWLGTSLPAGPLIILLAAGLYLGSSALRALQRRGLSESALRTAALLLLCVLGGCIAGDGRVEGQQAQADPGLSTQCSGASPATQVAIVESLHKGGLTDVKVVGWMCGRSSGGVLVRMVLLRYVHDAAHEGLVPVFFEDGRMVGFGWELLRREPARWGPNTPRPRDRIEPPDGWIAFDLR